MITITVRVIGQQSTEFVGPAYLIKDAAQAVSAALMRAPTSRGWLVRNEDAEDVLAFLEACGHRIEINL